LITLPEVGAISCFAPANIFKNALDLLFDSETTHDLPLNGIISAQFSPRLKKP
jgi:hypothetical protein